MVLAILILLSMLTVACAVQPIQPQASEKAANFEVSDLKNQKVSLSDFSNKTVVLFFWTTWCPYCREQLKILNGEYGQLEKDGVVVLPIDIGESQGKVESFIKSRNFTFRVFLDKDTKVSATYDILGVPAYILIDKKGFIRTKVHTFPKKEIKELM
jgi:peroxiredoxin